MDPIAAETSSVTPHKARVDCKPASARQLTCTNRCTCTAVPFRPLLSLHFTCCIAVMAALLKAGSCPRPRLPCLGDLNQVLLPSPNRRTFCERARRRTAQSVQPIQASKYESYVLVDPTPPTAQEAASKPALLGCAPFAWPECVHPVLQGRHAIR